MIDEDTGKTTPWKVRISDGWCEYEYEFIDGREDVSIDDVSFMLKLFLRASGIKHRRIDEI